MTTITQEALASRLRQARENARVTQEEAAGVLDVPRTAIVQIEAAKRAVSSLELAKLATLYGRDFVDFLAAEPPPAMEDSLVVLYRLDPAFDRDSRVRNEVRRALQICRAAVELESLLGLPIRSGPPSYRPSPPRTVAEAIAQGTSVAEQERHRLGLGDTPAADVAELINAQGVWATGVCLPDGMSGLCMQHPDTGLVILVNQGHSVTRKRFSYAHEFAHALLDRERAPGTVTRRENASELAEKRANAFAAAFLMPAAGVMQFLKGLRKSQPSRMEQAVFDVATAGRIDAEIRPAPGTQALGYPDVVAMQLRFGVSYPAALYRLRSLGVISERECDALLAQEDSARACYRLARPGQDPEGPAKEDHELVARIVRLAIEAYQRGEISRGRVLELADMVCIKGRDLLELAQAARAG